MRKKSKNTTELPAPAASPPWTDLPSDVTANILRRLDAVEILQSAQQVCATWWKVCQDPAMWKVIKIINLNDNMSMECSIMCRRAVDRSHGQLIELTIAGCGDDQLLDFIANRSSHLRSLTLAKCGAISGPVLTEAVKNLPQLEALHLISHIYPAPVIQTIAISCPALNSFSSNHVLSRTDSDYFGRQSRNEIAFAIANSMPNLCKLGLFANGLDNEGLRAILDGCPRLESLDLGVCFRLDLAGALGRRCCEQVKRVSLPYESVERDETERLLLSSILPPPGEECASVSGEDDESDFDFGKE